jgi:TRAP-type mannitol/chloroaromatic compound transport system permease large subunit
MVCTAGTLGQIIPPSTLLIILADVMSSAFQQAQYKQGKFSIETVSVGQTFAAALVPGLMLVVIYLVYLLVVAWLKPQAAPAMREAPEPPSRMAIIGAIVPPVLLIFAVLGAILAGIASPNEAASVGAVGAILLAGRRQGASRSLVLAGAVALVALAVAAGIAPVRIQRSDAGVGTYALAGIYTFLALVGLVAIFASLRALLKRGLAIPALVHTMTLTSMIFATILMASFFSLVFVGLGGESRVAEIIDQLPGGPMGALFFAMALIFILGFFLDFVEISVILLPLMVPPLIVMGHDPIWLAVLIAVNLQTSFLTPPFGFSLFYLRSAAPPEVTTGMIYRGVAPFIGLQILAMALIWAFPTIATWLPRAVF